MRRLAITREINQQTSDELTRSRKTGSGYETSARLDAYFLTSGYAKSFRALSARIFTTLRAGFALTVIISPGLNGFGR